MIKKNPFLINSYLKPKYICARKSETSEIINLLSKGKSVLVISEDGIGKTALLKNALYKLNKIPNYFPVYLDVSGKITTKRILKQFFNLLKDLGKLKITVNNHDTKASDRDNSNNYLESEMLDKILELIKKIEMEEKQTILCIDHLYHLSKKIKTELENILINPLLELTNTRLIVSGNDEEFRFVENVKIYLEPITNKSYKSFIFNKFKSGGKSISKKNINYILNWTQSDPYATQLVCNRLWSISEKQIKKQDVEFVLHSIICEYSQFLRKTQLLLTEIQWKLLVAIAENNDSVQLTSANIISNYELNAPSTVNTALKALLEKRMIYKIEKSYYIKDVILKNILSQQKNIDSNALCI